MNQILQSLLITAIGMGLVFILIILLLGFMVALVVLSNRWDFMASIEAGEEVTGEEKAEITTDTSNNKAGIIAVAVAAALVSCQKALHFAPLQPSKISSWQAVSRANTLSQISSIFNRKPRG